MLKIKDNVDLKELEKFGLFPKYDEDTGEIKGYSTIGKETNFYRRFLRISKKRKRLLFRKSKEMYIIDEDYFIRHSCWNCTDETCDFDALYALIQAGLVEKMVE